MSQNRSGIRMPTKTSPPKKKMRPALSKASIELHEAAAAGSPVLARRAMKSGADVHSIYRGMTPLHAVINACEKSFISIDSTADVKALVRLLLEHGVTASERSEALERAASLIKRNAYNTCHNGSRILADIIPWIESESSAARIPRTAVARSTVQTYRRLLFSENYSDVKFVLSDGTAVHAHQNILGTASDYFARCFEGHWRERQKEGFVFQTPHSKSTLEMVLSFIYTGDFDASKIKEDPGEMLSVSQEYELLELHHLTEQVCIQNLSMATVKSLLRMSDLYEATALKQACFDFIRKNPKALVNKSITALEHEQPLLWTQLVTAMGG